MGNSSSSELINAINDKQSTKFICDLVNTEDRMNETDANGNTALILACAAKMSDVARAIILINDECEINEDVIVNLDHKSNSGFSALAYACMNNMIDTVALLIKYGANVNKDINVIKETLASKNEPILMKLIEAGIDIKTPTLKCTQVGGKYVPGSQISGSALAYACMYKMYNAVDLNALIVGRRCKMKK